MSDDLTPEQCDWLIDQVAKSTALDNMTNIELADAGLRAIGEIPMGSAMYLLIEAMATRIDPTWTERHSPPGGFK